MRITAGLHLSGRTLSFWFLLVFLAVGGPVRAALPGGGPSRSDSPIARTPGGNPSREEAVEARRQVAIGWSHLGRGKPIHSEQAFRKAIRLDRKLAEAYRGLAESLLRQGDVPGATEVVHRALEQFPGDPARVQPLVEILSRNPSTRPEAIERFRRMVEVEPEDAPLRLALARSLAWSGNYREAARECRRIGEMTGEAGIRFQARHLEAQVLSWKGNQKDAGRIYRELLADRPGDRDLRLGLADSLSWGGWARRAERRYEEILREKPSPEAGIGLAEIARREGRWKVAQDRYREVLETSGEEPGVVDGWERTRRESSPSLKVIPSSFRDSADFDRDSYAAVLDLLQRRRLSLRTGAARIRYAQADDQQIYRTSFPLQGRLTVGRVFAAEAGVSRNEYDGAPDSTSFFLGGTLAPGNDRVRVRFGFDRYDLIDGADPFRENRYNQVETIDVARMGLDVEDLRGGLFLRFTGRLTFDLDLTRGSISDGNRRNTAYGRLTYRLPARPRVELFASLYYQNLEDRSPLYFDPANFQNWGLGALWSGETGRSFRYGIEGVVGFHPREEDLLGGQLQAYAERDLGDHIALRGSANYLVSPEERGVPGETYQSTYFSLSLVGRFHRTAQRPGTAPSLEP